MATYHLRRLCRPEILRAVDRRYPEALLAPHAEYLASRGVTLPLGGREAPLKYLALAQLLLAPDEGMPRELVDTLYFVDEMATPSGVEALLSAAEARGIRRSMCLEVAPAEVVLLLWLADRRLVERVHAEMAVRRQRAFDYFQPQSAKPPVVPEGLPARLQALETELNAQFHEHGYRRYTHIHLDHQEDSLWFYIAHGGMLRREAAIKNETPTTVCFRPEVYDSVVFVRLTGELGIHAPGPWEKQLYQRLFGKHVFGDEQLFSGTSKYTLQPLWNDGQSALRCLDVPGIEWVTLGELRTLALGREPRLESFKCHDLFASWGSRFLPISPTARLVSAGFHVKLLGCRRPRWVVIRPSNHAQYSRDVDRVWIETLLERRGFIQRPRGGEDASPETLLAVA
jgi:hypothetical protein